MIDGKPVLAIIPARGGSKGVPRKNSVTFRQPPEDALMGNLG